MRALFVLTAVALLPSRLVCQQRWEREVAARLDRAVSAVTAPPRAASVRRTGTLNSGEASTVPATLVQGTAYAIVAVCDDDCSRLQLTLLTPNGSEIAKERNSESLPIVHFTPTTTQPYRIRVVMEGCRVNPCWYALGIVPVAKRPS